MQEAHEPLPTADDQDTPPRKKKRKHRFIVCLEHLQESTICTMNQGTETTKMDDGKGRTAGSCVSSKELITVWKYWKVNLCVAIKCETTYIHLETVNGRREEIMVTFHGGRRFGMTLGWNERSHLWWYKQVTASFNICWAESVFALVCFNHLIYRSPAVFTFTGCGRCIVERSSWKKVLVQFVLQ